MVKWKPTIVLQTSKQGKSLDARSNDYTRKICTVATPINDDGKFKKTLDTGTKINMHPIEKYQIDPTKINKGKLIKTEISKKRQI